MNQRCPFLREITLTVPLTVAKMYIVVSMDWFVSELQVQLKIDDIELNLEKSLIKPGFDKLHFLFTLPTIIVYRGLVGPINVLS